MVDPNDDPIELVESQYDEWQERFAAERERIQATLAARGLDDLVDRVEHVGSTAVPGLTAKDIVDLDVVVADDAVGDVSAALVEELGGDRAENSPGWHPVFRVHDGHRFNDHVFARSDDGWQISVVTRDVLRARPDLRDEYERRKRALAADHDDLTAYSRGKTALVARLLETAREDDEFDYEFGVPDLP